MTPSGTPGSAQEADDCSGLPHGDNITMVSMPERDEEMSTRDFYMGSKPTRLGARLGDFGQRHIIRGLRKKYQIQRVLEIGSGKGIVARACRDYGIEYLGIDGSDIAAI